MAGGGGETIIEVQVENDNPAKLFGFLPVVMNE
jgi:hypothetical protein